jgi:glycosyltransferase involved in cell wall biosynthesis
MNKPFVTFYTRAYNAERYIEKTIESILNQSEGNIEWILVNNGSTDNTGEICKRYAEKDKRIIYLENEKNTFLHPEYKDKGKQARVNGEYYSILDADDYLDLDFVKIMYPVAKDLNADMAICGNNVIFSENETVKSARIPPRLSTTNIEEIGEQFEEFYGCLRTVWAKLYKTEFYRNNIAFAWDKPKWMKSGSDTFAVLRYLSRCKIFVSLDKPLYYFRVHDESFYNTNISPDRVRTYKILFEEGVKLLKVLKAETKENINFLQDVHMSSITDCLRSAANNVSEKLSDRLRLVNTIAKDDFFCSYALKNESRRITTGVIKDIVNLIIRDVSSLELSKSGDFFIARIYKYENNLPLLLSAICSKDNKYLWGLELLEEQGTNMKKSVRELLFNTKDDLKFLLRNPKALREKLSDNLDLWSQKEELINLIDNGDLEQAIGVLSDILGKNMLDREGLYFKMYIAWQIGEKDTAVETAEIAKVFYQDDLDLMIMCGDIFSYIGSKDNAKDCYLYAVKNCEDEALMDDLQKRIRELS